MSDPLADLTADYPTANPSAIDAEDRRERERIALLRDKHGRAFDSNLHAVDAHGRPMVGARGMLLSKNTRPTKSANFRPAGSITPPLPGAAQSTVRVAPGPEAVGAATATIDFATGTAAGLWGDKWHPRSGEERAAVIDAWARWYQARGIRDVPPGVLVLLVTGGYISARLDEPARERIASKLGRYARWIGSKLGGRFARPDTRPDGDGKDATRGDAGGAVQDAAPTGPRNVSWQN